MLREIAEELRALGWDAVAHGPEIHLALPLLYAAIGAAALWIWRTKK